MKVTTGEFGDEERFSFVKWRAESFASSALDFEMVVSRADHKHRCLDLGDGFKWPTRSIAFKNPVTTAMRSRVKLALSLGRQVATDRIAAISNSTASCASVSITRRIRQRPCLVCLRQDEARPFVNRTVAWVTAAATEFILACKWADQWNFVLVRE